MGLGMLGIFIVIGLIMVVTFVLNKIFSKKNDDQ
ncbi:MAG: oxaloacetate decarboxylase [Clostridia bacterium]|nr:oxaloacetate decarboxylase [Clostridia bacterium]